ncbi:hypothetical protein E5845_09660 [Pseudomonas fluorescens]|nr:hypothetical protein E5845_09660 [Pseudomonas fluorescens]
MYKHILNEETCQIPL